jgi:D-hydroxyproline dehydrogenase subunit beta
MRRRSCNLAIVGGGITGAWCLHFAAQKFPAWRIILLESSRIAGGATAHSAGVFFAVGRSDRERHLAARSAVHYAAVRNRFTLESSEAPAYWIADRAALPSLLKMSVGFTVECCQGGLEGATDSWGLRVVRDTAETLFCGGTSISMEPAAVATALIRHAALSSSASVCEGVGVQQIDAAAGAIELVLSDGSILTAGRIIVAVGPWIAHGPMANGLIESVASERDIRIKKVVALHIDRSPVSRSPAIFLHSHDAYLMPIPRRKQWLFSFRSEEWNVKVEGQALTISQIDRDLAHSILGQYFPGLVDHCFGGRVFCDAYTADSEPVVSSRDNDRLIVVGAGSGAGFRLAPGLAEEAVLRLV